MSTQSTSETRPNQEAEKQAAMDNLHREKIAANHSDLFDQAIGDLSKGLVSIGDAMAKSKLLTEDRESYSESGNEQHRPLLGASVLGMLSNMWMATRSMTENMHPKPESASPPPSISTKILKVPMGSTPPQVIQNMLESLSDEIAEAAGEEVDDGEDDDKECECIICRTQRAIKSGELMTPELAAQNFVPSLNQSDQNETTNETPDMEQIKDLCDRIKHVCVTYAPEDLARFLVLFHVCLLNGLAENTKCESFDQLAKHNIVAFQEAYKEATMKGAVEESGGEATE